MCNYVCVWMETETPNAVSMPQRHFICVINLHLTSNDFIKQFSESRQVQNINRSSPTSQPRHILNVVVPGNSWYFIRYQIWERFGWK